jgi:hypothetical protein
MKTLPVSGSGTALFGSGVPLIKRAVRAGCLTLALVLSSSVVSADPVSIVSGFFGSGGDDTGFWAVGSNVSLSTGAIALRMEPVVTCGACTPGTDLNLSATVTIRDWGPGSATLDGQTWSEVYYGGSLVFNAGSVVIPDVQVRAPSP